MKKSAINCLAITMLLPAAAFAAAPEGYYASLAGKKGDELRRAIKSVVANHTVISYGDKTWGAFEKTDVREYDGRQIWFDIYSNAIEPTATGHATLNIEHSVPKSWWGGTSNNAYKDIVHLNPSNASANNAKSNWPLGIISGNPTWTNGITSMGVPTQQTGGEIDGAKCEKVFEPADEYKGDFARTYFYIFTVYNDISWLDTSAWMYDTEKDQDGNVIDVNLKPWAYEMLLEWSKNDPVDSRELARNEAIYEVQKNRNPFIDLPQLADYIWGGKSSEELAAADMTEAVAVNRPAAPQPKGEGYSVTAVNGFGARWWDETEVVFDIVPENAIFHYTLDNETWQTVEGGEVPIINIPAATGIDDKAEVKSYISASVGGILLNSAVTTVYLTAFDPDGDTDMTKDNWAKVKSGDEISTEKSYLIVPIKANRPMAATAAAKYVEAVDNAVTITDDVISSIPDNTGIIGFETSGSGYTISVSDIRGQQAGYLSSTAAKSLGIAETGSVVEVSINSDDTVTISFGDEIGTLQYNASSPRFAAYTSNQQGIYLFARSETPSVGIEEVDGWCEEETTMIYTLSGMRCENRNLAPGIYIFVKGGKATKQVIR